jgi:Putative peptidoglycan binding domain
MKAILYSVCIGSLALALTGAGAQPATEKNKRQEGAKPQQRSANAQAARPATAARPTSAMPATARAQRNVSAAQFRQGTYAKSRASSAVNPAAAGPASATPATIRQRHNVAAKTPAARPASTTAAKVNRDRNVAVNRNRNSGVNDAKRPASAPPATANVNRFRNTNEFRDRRPTSATSATVVNRNVTVNRTQNAAFYRGRNVTITNNWRGNAFSDQRYWAFRNYNRQWHDRSWWRSHYNRIIFVNSGWWYWNAGYWFPAWGFAPYVSYVYDGPIYAYNGLSPDQVTVNVQEQLAAAGYYDGPIDGVLGPITREAIAAYQADNGLAITSAIDEPTLATMGLV